MFSKESGLVQTWVHLVQEGAYTVDQVPNLSNLRDVVKEVLEGGEK